MPEKRGCFVKETWSVFAADVTVSIFRPPSRWIELYCRCAGRIREARNDFSRESLRFDRARTLGVGGRPNPLLESVERKLAGFENPMAHGETTAPPLTHFTLDNDLVIEATGQNESRAQFDDRHADDLIFLAHRRRGQASALK